MDDEQFNEGATGPGEVLRHAREKKGLRVEDIAKQLHLTSAHVEDIERNDYSLSPGLTFTRGYIRTYANFVDVDPESVIAMFNHLGLTEDRPILSPVMQPNKKTRVSEKHRHWLLYLLLMGVMVLTLMWWQTKEHSVTSPVATLSNNGQPSLSVASSAEQKNPIALTLTHTTPSTAKVVQNKKDKKS